MKTNGIHWFPLCIPPTPRQNLPSAGFLFLFLASSECAARPRLSMRLLHLAMMSCANPRKSSYKGSEPKGKRKEIEGSTTRHIIYPSTYNAQNCHFSVLLRSLFQKKYKNFFVAYIMLFSSFIYWHTLPLQRLQRRTRCFSIVYGRLSV